MVSTTIWEMVYSLLSIKSIVPLSQVTFVAGPPVEVQVRVNTGVSAVNADVSVNCIAARFIPPMHEEQELNVLYMIHCQV